VEHVDLAMAAPVDPSRLVVETVGPQRDPTKAVCEVAGTYATCVKRQAGPLIVTDAVAPSRCRTELFIGASDESGKLTWFVEANAPGVHGGRLFVRSDQMLTIAARGVGVKTEGGPLCVVTWAGFRPRIVPFSLGGGSRE
jgi:hypothetical protein